MLELYRLFEISSVMNLLVTFRTPFALEGCLSIRSSGVGVCNCLSSRTVVSLGRGKLQGVADWISLQASKNFIPVPDCGE